MQTRLEIAVAVRGEMHLHLHLTFLDRTTAFDMHRLSETVGDVLRRCMDTLQLQLTAVDIRTQQTHVDQRDLYLHLLNQEI